MSKTRNSTDPKSWDDGDASHPFIAHMERYVSDCKALERVLEVTPAPLSGLWRLEPRMAAEEIRVVLGSSTYVPTGQSLSLASRILSLGISHARRVYPDRMTFIEKSSSLRLATINDPVTWLITGLAGVGKSSLLTTLMSRVFQEAPLYQPSDHCPPRRVLGGIYIAITSRASKSESIKLLSEALGIQAHLEKPANAVDSLRRELYRQGVCFILADETQVQSSGTTAGAAYVNYLSFLRSLGVPVIFVGNYSMCHAILKQPPQNTQRLLVDPFIMRPDHADSADYQRRLKCYARVCQEFLRIDPLADCAQLCEWTGGMNRALINLIVIAYAIQREKGTEAAVKVDMDALMLAYQSTAYSSLRAEVRLLERHLLLKEKVRDALMCPFAAVGEEAADEERKRDAEMTRRIHQAQVDSLLGEKVRTTADVSITPATAKAAAAFLRQARQFVAETDPAASPLGPEQAPSGRRAVESGKGTRTTKKTRRPKVKASDAQCWSSHVKSERP